MAISTDSHAALRERFGDAVVFPGDAGYDDARRVWNGVIDRHPAVVARCASTDEVVAALAYAREHDLAIAIRGGGHNVAGTAVVDDGLVIDLSAMRAVRIDSSGRTVHVQGGATWADVDRVTAPLGLATPGGVVSETGVARKNARVTVKGTVREGFNFGALGDLIKLPAGISAGMVLMESSHKAR